MAVSIQRNTPFIRVFVQVHHLYPCSSAAMKWSVSRIPCEAGEVQNQLKTFGRALLPD